MYLPFFEVSGVGAFELEYDFEDTKICSELNKIGTTRREGRTVGNYKYALWPVGNSKGCIYKLHPSAPPVVMGQPTFLGTILAGVDDKWSRASGITLAPMVSAEEREALTELDGGANVSTRRREHRRVTGGRLVSTVNMEKIRG